MPMLLAFLWLDFLGQAMFGDERTGPFNLFNDVR